MQWREHCCPDDRLGVWRNFISGSRSVGMRGLARHPARRAAGRLPLHLLVEQVLGLGLCQGVPVGYGIRERVVPHRWPACRSDRWRLGRLADGQVRMRCTGAASVIKATIHERPLLTAVPLPPDEWPMSVQGRDLPVRTYVPTDRKQRGPVGQPPSLSGSSFGPAPQVCARRASFLWLR